MKEVKWNTNPRRHVSYFGENHHSNTTMSSSSSSSSSPSLATTDDDEQLRITIVRAENLINVEKGLKFLNGVSDPFCEMYIGGLCNKFYRTETVNDNLNPVWNDSTVLSLTNATDRILIFQIWDKNVTRVNVLMGTCGLALGALSLRRQVPMQLTLHVYQKVNGKNELGGLLHIELEALNFELTPPNNSDGSGGGDSSYDIATPTSYYQVDMSVFDDSLGKSRSLKSILGNEITREEDARLDQVFGYDMIDDIYDQFETGDVLLHSGVGTFSMYIMLFLKCMWSHVSILIKDPSPAMRQAFNIPDDTKGRVFVLEADSELIDRSKKQGGVQLVELKQWMEAYYEESGPTDFCAYRKLVLPHNAESEKKRMTLELESFVTGLPDVTYEQNKLDLVKCIFKKNKKSDVSSLFCSEIVAQTLLQMGLLPQTTITSNYSPKDFSSLSTDLNHVLLLGATYTKERRVRFVPPPAK